MDLTTFSAKGGRATSSAKTAANRAKAKAYWAAVRAGVVTGPRRPRVPPSPERLGALLSEYCRSVGITRLEVFGSSARGVARKGSDVDLIGTFALNPGIRYFGMQTEMSALVGARVHLLTRAGVEGMANTIRRDAILSEARPVYIA